MIWKYYKVTLSEQELIYLFKKHALHGLFLSFKGFQTVLVEISKKMNFDKSENY